MKWYRKPAAYFTASQVTLFLGGICWLSDFFDLGLFPSQIWQPLMLASIGLALMALYYQSILTWELSMERMELHENPGEPTSSVLARQIEEEHGEYDKKEN